MKKIFTLATLMLIFASSIFAQNSNMVFFTEQGEKFLLYLNGNQQNELPMSNVKILQMPSSIYQVRIEFENKTYGSINDKVTLNPSTEKTWKIRLKDLDTRNKVNQTLNNVGIEKGANTTNKYVLKALSEIPLNTVTQGIIPNQQVVNYQPQGYGFSTNTAVNVDPNMQGGGANVGFQVDPNGSVNMNMNVGGAGQGVGVNTQNGTYTNTNITSGNVQQQGYQIQNTGHRGCAAPLATNLFNAEKAKVRAQKTAAGKFIICKKIIATKCLTSQQAYELIGLLTFSKDKLEAAKLAYKRSFDPDNFEVVYNVFSLSSQVDELNQYIESVNATWATTNNGGTINSSTTTTTTTTTSTGQGGNTNWNYNNNTTQQNTNNNGNSWNSNPVPDYTGPTGCPSPMAASAFETAKTSISTKSFESTKLEVAKQIVGQNCMTSSQVLQITKLFGFEASKLEFAKFAYSHTFDKANYFKVNDAFGFESSITELQEYIKGE